ncbi:MAG: hypothetical protein IPM42_01820 [Saprospiraceae bacterium]|nr:hypothetical protein [Saprospiraceae bacterium]
METGSIIFSAILIILCVAPFIVLQRTKINSQNKLINALKNLAKDYDSEISHYEVCGNIVIGLDSNSENVFYYKKYKNEEVVSLVKLQDVKACKVVQTTRSNDGVHKFIDKIVLQFEPKNKTQQLDSFEFYNSEESLQLNGELQDVGRWEQLIQSKL